MKNDVKKQNGLFALFYLLAFSALGGFMPYINQYLQVNQGFSGAQLGIFTFCTLIVAVFVVPLWGVAGDKTGRYKWLLLISLGSSIVAAYLYSIQTGYLAVLISGIILEVCRSGIMPLSDVQAMNFATKNHTNYGFIRSMGSLGFVVGSVLVGQLVTKNDYSRMLVIYITLLLLSLAIALTFPNTKSEAKETDKPKGSILAVLSNRKFLFIAILSLLTTVLMDSANGYAGIHMVNQLGGGSNSAGLFTAATAFPEILLLGFIGKWFDKYGYKKIYLLNAIVLVVRYAIYVIAPNSAVFLIASLVHCLATGVSTVGNLAYLKASIPDDSYGTAVSLYNATVSVGRAVYSLIFGYMLDWFGSTSIFLFAGILMVIAAFWITRTHAFDAIDQKN